MLEAVNCIRWVARDSGGAAEVFLLLPIAVTSRNCSGHEALYGSGCRVATSNDSPMCLREGISSAWLQKQVFYCGRSIVLVLRSKRML